MINKEDRGINAGPLAGVRVLDMTAALSGPVASHILADMGADVIKVESPGGDSIRGLGPARHQEMGPMFLHCNRNKRSVVLDLKTQGGKETFLRLADTVDIVVCNTRRKAMERLGLCYDSIARRNPEVIYISIVGYGSNGPLADKPAYDDLIQAAAGIPSLHPPDEHARYAPIALADRLTGVFAANAALGALYYRSCTGTGQHVEVPMFETLAAFVLNDHMGGCTFEPAAGPPVFERYATVRRPFETDDGHICVMVLTDRQWKQLFDVLGRSELIKDDRFSSVGARAENISELYGIVAEILKTRSTGEWLDLLQAADIPVGQVETVESLLQHPQLMQTGFFEWVDHPTEGRIRSMASTSSWSATPLAYRKHAPRLGEHTREILHEAGLSALEIERLEAEGAVTQGGISVKE